MTHHSPRHSSYDSSPRSHSTGTSFESSSAHSTSSQHSKSSRHSKHSNRTSSGRDFCVIAEFCERRGPLILHSVSSSPYDDISSRIDFRQLSLRLMSVDYQTTTPKYLTNPHHLYISTHKQKRSATLFSAIPPPVPKETDSILQYSQNNRRWYAYVRHFTSYDLQARGRVRAMCVAYLTLNLPKLTRNFDIIRSNLSIVTFFLRCGNLVTFLSDSRQRLLDLTYTKDSIRKVISLKQKSSKSSKHSSSNSRHSKKPSVHSNSPRSLHNSQWTGQSSSQSTHSNPSIRSQKNGNGFGFSDPAFDYLFSLPIPRLSRSYSTAQKQYESLQRISLGLRRSLIVASSKVGLDLIRDNTHVPTFYLTSSLNDKNRNRKYHSKKHNVVRIFDNAIPEDDLEFHFAHVDIDTTGNNGNIDGNGHENTLHPNSNSSSILSPRIIDVLATFQSNRSQGINLSETGDSFGNFENSAASSSSSSLAYNDSPLLPSHGNLRSFHELFGEFEFDNLEFTKGFANFGENRENLNPDSSHPNFDEYITPRGKEESIFDYYFSCFLLAHDKSGTGATITHKNKNLKSQKNNLTDESSIQSNGNNTPFHYYFSSFLEDLPQGFHDPFKFYFSHYIPIKSLLTAPEIFKFYFGTFIDSQQLIKNQENIFAFYFEKYNSDAANSVGTTHVTHDVIDPWNFYFSSFIFDLDDSQSTLLHDTPVSDDVNSRLNRSQRLRLLQKDEKPEFSPLTFALRHLADFLSYFSQSSNSFTNNVLSVRDAQQHSSWISIGNLILPTMLDFPNTGENISTDTDSPAASSYYTGTGTHTTTSNVSSSILPSAENLDGHLPDLFHAFGIHIVATPLENLDSVVWNMLETFPVTPDSPLNHNPTQFSYLMKEISKLSLHPGYSKRFDAFFYKLFPWRTQDVQQPLTAPIQILPPHYFHQMTLPTPLFWLANYMSRLYTPSQPMKVPQFPPFGYIFPTLEPLLPHIVFSLLTCRPVVVIGQQYLVRQIIACLSYFVPMPNPSNNPGAGSGSGSDSGVAFCNTGSYSNSVNQPHLHINPWVSIPKDRSKSNDDSGLGLIWEDVKSLLLFGCSRFSFANSPIGLQYSCSILDIETKVFYGPPYSDGKILWSWFGLDPAEPSQYSNNLGTVRKRSQSIGSSNSLLSTSSSISGSVSPRGGMTPRGTVNNVHGKHGPNSPHGSLFVPTKVDPKWVSSASQLSETRTRVMSKIHKLAISFPPPSLPWFGWNDNPLSLPIPRLNPDDTTFTLFFQHELKKLFSLVQIYSHYYNTQTQMDPKMSILDQHGTPGSMKSVFPHEDHVDSCIGKHKIITLPIDSSLPYSNPVFGVSLETQFAKSSSRVPRILLEVIRYLQPYLATSEGLFRVPGNSAEIALLKHQIDSGPYSHIFQGHSPHTVASLLKAYLMQIPEPLFMWANYERLIDLGSRNVVAFRPDTDSKENPIHRSLRILITRLPLANRLTLGTLFRFLNQVCNHSHYNKMTASNISMVFGPSLIRSEQHISPEVFLTHSSAMKNIVSILISHVDHFFPIDHSGSGSGSSSGYSTIHKSGAETGTGTHVPPSSVIDYDTSLTTEWDDDIQMINTQSFSEEILTKYGTSDIEIFHSLSSSIFSNAKFFRNDTNLSLVDYRPCIHLSVTDSFDYPDGPDSSRGSADAQDMGNGPQKQQRHSGDASGTGIGAGSGFISNEARVGGFLKKLGKMF